LISFLIIIEKIFKLFSILWKMGKATNFLLIIAILVLIVAIYLLIQTKNETKKLEEKIAFLEEENSKYEQKIKKMEDEITNFERFFKNITAAKVKNVSWDELKVFLKLDKTNELIYDKENFDCTGFAVELFKNARQIGINAGIAEIEFFEEAIGHTLNAFYTEKGLVFIDVTGMENGKGKDKIAYIKLNMPYGTVFLEKAKEEIFDCDVECYKFVDGLEKIKADIFSYNYLERLMKCKEILERCAEEYNKEVEKFNAGKSDYSYNQLITWRKNLETLHDEITEENFYIFSIGEKVKNLKIYF